MDFLRGVAILLVVCAHAVFPKSGIPWMDRVIEGLPHLGPVGVSLFFTLSGFLVGGLLMEEIRKTGTINARRFLMRRVFKIWPGFYALILFHALIQRHPLDTFFWQNFFQVQNYFGSSLSHTWSLAVEEHFYLLLTVTLWCVAAKPPRTMVATLGVLCVLSLGLRLAFVQAGAMDAAFYQTQCRMDGLLYGVLLAWLRVFKPETYAKFASRRRLLAAIALAAIPWILFAAARPALEFRVGYTLEGLCFCAAIVLLWECGPQLASHAAFRTVASVGVFSYSIYLWHTMVLTPGKLLAAFLVAHGLGPWAAGLIAAAAQVGVAIVIGYGMARLIEFPFLRLRERLEPRWAASAAVKSSS